MEPITRIAGAFLVGLHALMRRPDLFCGFFHPCLRIPHIAFGEARRIGAKSNGADHSVISDPSSEVRPYRNVTSRRVWWKRGTR